MKLNNQELLEMASITYKSTGIENIVIWINKYSDYKLSTEDLLDNLKSIKK